MKKGKSEEMSCEKETKDERENFIFEGQNCPNITMKTFKLKRQNRKKKFLPIIYFIYNKNRIHKNQN